MALRTPPANYGGLERVVYEHAQGLAELGHDVTLVATKDSEAPSGVKLVECVKPWNKLNQAEQIQYSKLDGIEREWRGQKWIAHKWNGWRAQEQEAYSIYKDLIKEHDVVLDHSWSKWSYQAKKEETIGTCHSVMPYGEPPPRQHPLFTGVSNGHSRALAARLHVPVRTLWNPVNIEEFPLVRSKTDRILSLNRIMPQKGIHLFVKMINNLQLKADVVGDDSTLVQDQGYVQHIKDECKKSAYLSYHGLVDDRTRIRFLSDAKCLVCFKDGGYEEIFGLSAAEALACGTPVVALKSWGFSDLIDGTTNGFVCDTVEQVEDAVKRIATGNVTFSAEDCRKSVERFTRQNRAKAYEEMLVKVKDGSRW